MKTTYNTKYSNDLCHRTSLKLRNHLIHLLYNKKKILLERKRQAIHLLPTDAYNEDFRDKINTHIERNQAKTLENKKRKLQKILPPEIHTKQQKEVNHNQVINLSDHQLTQAETTVLTKGLNFCPSSKLDKIQICGDTERYIRRLRLKEYYRENTIDDSNDHNLDNNTLIRERKTSIWTPRPGRNATLEKYIDSLRHCVNSQILTKQKRTRSNLDITERKAIQSLKNNHDIIIKPADKGGATVVMNRTDYLNEAQNQLDNPEYYTRLPSDPTPTYIKALKNLIRSFPEDDQNKLANAVPDNPKPGTFYTLPKIHKPSNPGRPIISGIGTLTENISGAIENIIKPMIRNTKSYIQDTTDFLNSINNIDNLPEDAILVTMDVVSLYSNIPHDEGLKALDRFLNNYPNTPLEKNSILKLTEFILKHNYFSFDDNNMFYLQIKGTAMGTRMAPHYANIFMADLEEEFLITYPLLPLRYSRFIDDIFLIWTHGEKELLKFHSTFNSRNPHIKLTMNYSKISVDFLDTTVILKNKRLETTIYRKPTDTFSYLHPDSYHPSHIKKSIIYSQTIRYNRICSNPKSLSDEIGELKKAFRSLGYDENMINEQTDKALRIPRNDLLKYQHKENVDRIPFVVTYNHNILQLKRILNGLQHIFTNDPELNEIFKHPPLISYRQPANLKTMLVKSRVNQETSGTFPCNAPRCKLCPVIENEEIIIKPSNKIFKPTGTFNCNSKNVVYLIRCRKCPDTLYIGETSQSIRNRITGHRQSINQKWTYLPISEHFNKSNHTCEDLKVTILKGNIYNISDRQIEEQRLISLFNSVSQGLNRDEAFLKHYIRN